MDRGRSEWKESLKGKALADSFRSEIVSAARRGEAFEISTGRPLSMRRAALDMSWYRLACSFVDMKWPRVAATTRRTHAEALTAVTTGLFMGERGKPDDKLIRLALGRWAFNTTRRDGQDVPGEIREALRWVERHSLPVSALARPDVLRSVLDGLTVRLDGRPAASSVVSRRRKIFNTAVEYAVELGALEANPIPALPWSAPKSLHTVDRRVVGQSGSGPDLLEAVREQPRNGPRLLAFYACLYFAGLRPGEAAALSTRHLALPPSGWGWFHLDGAKPHAGKDWTDAGGNRDERQLKQRARGEVRTVPCPPELTQHIHDHVREYGTGPDGRLFRGDRNATQLPNGTVVVVWRRARARAFTPEVLASRLARTPYDLRHAAVSTWLNGGVPPADVAAWAGHSVEILLKIYAKCLDGGTELLRQRVQAALGHGGGAR